MASVSWRKLRSWKLQKDTKRELLQLRMGVSTLILLIKHIYDRMDRLNSTENDNSDYSFPVMCVMEIFPWLPDNFFYELAGVWGSRAC